MDFVLCNFMLICHVQVNTLCSLVPKPPPFFVVWFAFSIAAALQLPCIILNTNKNRKQGKAWEQATCYVCINTTSVCAFVDVHPLQLGLSVFR